MTSGLMEAKNVMTFQQCWEHSNETFAAVLFIMKFKCSNEIENGIFFLSIPRSNNYNVMALVQLNGCMLTCEREGLKHNSKCGHKCSGEI